MFGECVEKLDPSSISLTFFFFFLTWAKINNFSELQFLPPTNGYNDKDNDISMR